MGIVHVILCVAGSSKSVSNMSSDKKKALPSFWIPSLTPAAKPAVVKKPVGLGQVLYMEHSLWCFIHSKFYSHMSPINTINPEYFISEFM